MIYTLPMLSLEMRLAQRLKQLGDKTNPFSGDTSFQGRRERMRAVCRKFSQASYGLSDGKPVTIGQQFVRTYGCDL